MNPSPNTPFNNQFICSDSPAFGGLNRVDDSITYTTLYNEIDGRHFLKVYAPNRTVLVFKKV